MKFITIRTHGFLDYITVAAFAVIPTAFGLEGISGYLCYILAAVHLLMTVLTAFQLGLVQIIPIRLHKIVEMIVGPVLLVAPWILGFSANTTARNVYIVMGLIIIAVGQLTRYTHKHDE